MSEYFVKYLRNRYGYTCVAIQQQASESEGLEAIKQKRMIPAASTLADSRYTSRDADIVLGLFDPSKFGLSSWLGYPIAASANGIGLEKYARFMYVIANRNGEMGGICPLFFDGAVCHFEELPKPEEYAGWENVVPGLGWWDSDFSAATDMKAYSGYAWYAKDFVIPSDFPAGSYTLALGCFDETDLVFVNGTLVGGTGLDTENWRHREDCWDSERQYAVDASLLKFTNSLDRGRAKMITLAFYFE